MGRKNKGGKRGRPRKDAAQQNGEAGIGGAPASEVDAFEAALDAEGEDASVDETADDEIEAALDDEGEDSPAGGEGDGADEADPIALEDLEDPADTIAAPVALVGRLVCGEPSSLALEELLAANALDADHVLGWRTVEGGAVKLTTKGGRKLATGDVLELRPVEKDGIPRPEERRGRGENFLRPGSYKAPGK